MSAPWETTTRGTMRDIAGFATRCCWNFPHKRHHDEALKDGLQDLRAVFLYYAKNCCCSD
jgi:hypothetical protein